MKKHSPSFSKKNSPLRRNFPAVIVVIAFVAIGVVYLSLSHAFSPYVNKEAESGTLTSPANKVNNSSASGGSEVQFGTSAPANSPLYWMINDGELSGVIKAGLPTNIMDYFFNSSHGLLITGSSPTVDSQLPNAAKVYKSASEANLAKITNFPAGTSYLGYDNESWPSTPSNEQMCPIDYEKIVQQIAAVHKLKFIFTPGTDLALHLANTSICKIPLANLNIYSMSSSVSVKYPNFLNLNFSGIAAPYSEILEIQAQQINNDAASFLYFSQNAINQANVATGNKVPILLGLTTDDAQQTFTLSELMAAYNETKSIAQGYWLNIPGTGTPDPSLAVSFLEAVYHSETGN